MAANTTETRGRVYLPSEIQYMILELCTWPTHSEPRLSAGTDKLAVLAAVCQNWRDFFEDKLFQRLTLKTKADIQTFAELVQGKRRAHDCEECHHLETPEDSQIQNTAFNNLVGNLFDVLSTWKSKDVRNDGLTLELSAHSPSDAHHFNKDLRFRLHDTAWDRWDDRPVEPHNDPDHGWKDGKQIQEPPKEAMHRLFGFGLCFDDNLPSVRRPRIYDPPATRLPKVSVVTSLVIRRQFPRTIAVQNGLYPMIYSLSRLNSFLYEPWRGPTSRYLKSQDSAHAFLAGEALKARGKTLKKVSIFESHYENSYHAPRYGTSEDRDVGLFSRDLARTSHHLEELCVAKNIDAFEFLYTFKPHAPPGQRRWMAWNNLKDLSLTTEQLAPGHTDLIILMAAKAAKTMPQLQIMELWNFSSCRGIASIFRFRRGETEASIELLYTWPDGVNITAATKAAWGRVASAHRPFPLRWNQSCWKSGVIEGEHSVLSQLELVEHMLHHVSFRQIASEDQRRREGKKCLINY